MNALLLSALLACTDTTGPAAATPPERGAQAREARETARATADPIPTAPNPKAYSQAWLVLLKSSKVKGELPDAWTALQASSLAVRPERLDSGHFKGLMPCYEITIAAAEADKSKAKALSQELKAAEERRASSPHAGPTPCPTMDHRPLLDAADIAAADTDAPWMRGTVGF